MLLIAYDQHVSKTIFLLQSPSFSYHTKHILLLYILSGNAYGLLYFFPFQRKKTFSFVKVSFSFSMRMDIVIISVTGKEMATHSSVLAWRIPGTEEPGGLLSMGSHRVGHD